MKEAQVTAKTGVDPLAICRRVKPGVAALAVLCVALAFVLNLAWKIAHVRLLNVDVGSLRTGDPYEEIARLAPFACTWQIKERLYRRGREEKTDVRRVFAILREAGYRGYAPIETLGDGDPREKVQRFLDEAREALS